MHLGRQSERASGSCFRCRVSLCPGIRTWKTQDQKDPLQKCRCGRRGMLSLWGALDERSQLQRLSGAAAGSGRTISEACPLPRASELLQLSRQVNLCLDLNLNAALFQPSLLRAHLPCMKIHTDLFAQNTPCFQAWQSTRVLTKNSRTS